MRAWVVGLVAVATVAMTCGCSGAQAGTTPATSKSTGGTPAAGQRIAIEERWKTGASHGTFVLIPLTPGPIRRDAGTFTFPDAAGTNVVRRGQSVAIYHGTDTLHAKHGTLILPNITALADAGSGYNAGTANWLLKSGTGRYEGLHGGGGGAILATPNGLVLTRYEGYLRSNS